jgi:riboflavin synthase
MFTGIVETIAEVQKKTSEKLVIARPQIFPKLSIGQSIAVNGACLSVSEYDEKSISFNVLSETFRRTNLSESKEVNLERAMLANGRFEGHIVLGHVDTTLRLLKKNTENSGVEYVFELPEDEEEQKFFVSKGSISLNGVSLTIGNISSKDENQKNTFSVFLIPLTLEKTNLGNLKINEKVTVEYDYLAKFMINKQ